MIHSFLTLGSFWYLYSELFKPNESTLTIFHSCVLTTDSYLWFIFAFDAAWSSVSDWTPVGGAYGEKKTIGWCLALERVYANVCAPGKDISCANLIFHVMAPLTEYIVMEYWKQHKHSFSESQHWGLSHPISCGSYRTVWIDKCMYDQQTRVIKHYNITTRFQEWAEDLQYSK